MGIAKRVCLFILACIGSAASMILLAFLFAGSAEAITHMVMRVSSFSTTAATLLLMLFLFMYFFCAMFIMHHQMQYLKEFKFKVEPSDV